jgi:hypothetical protein
MDLLIAANSKATTRVNVKSRIKNNAGLIDRGATDRTPV